MSANKANNRFQKAVDALHVKGSRLILMHSTSGMEYFIIPGDIKVSAEDAQKILARPDVIAFEDGLFPGNSQTWRIQR